VFAHTFLHFPLYLVEAVALAWLAAIGAAITRFERRSRAAVPA